jgi:hypothetical protein
MDIIFCVTISYQNSSVFVVNGHRSLVGNGTYAERPASPGQDYCWGRGRLIDQIRYTRTATSNRTDPGISHVRGVWSIYLHSHVAGKRGKRVPYR